MEINRFGKTYRVIATSREIVLSVFFAALCGGLALSLATGILLHQFVGLTAYATMENKAALIRANVELKSLTLEVQSCEKRIMSCLGVRKKR